MSLSGITFHSSSKRLREGGGDMETCASSSRRGRRDRLNDLDPAKSLPSGTFPHKKHGSVELQAGRKAEVIQAAAPPASAEVHVFTAAASPRRRAEQNRTGLGEGREWAPAADPRCPAAHPRCLCAPDGGRSWSEEPTIPARAPGWMGGGARGRQGEGREREGDKSHTQDR